MICRSQATFALFAPSPGLIRNRAAIAFRFARGKTVPAGGAPYRQRLSSRTSSPRQSLTLKGGLAVPLGLTSSGSMFLGPFPVIWRNCDGLRAACRC